MGKCVVIGASSFIGVYTVDAFLDAGWEIVGTGRNKSFADYYAGKGVRYVPYDLDDSFAPEVLPKDVDCVVHLAGRLPANSTSNLDSEDDAAAYLRTNALGIANLVEWARRNGVQRVITTTSYADVRNFWSAYKPIREDMPRSFLFTGDHAAYVISKNAACDILRYYNEQHGMNNCAFRLPPVYGLGPHASLNVNGKRATSGIGRFIELARDGRPITVFGKGDAGRDIVYVKDVARAFTKAADSKEARGLYNIGSGRMVSLLDQARVIAEVFAGANGVSEVFSDSTRVNGVVPYVMDISKARHDFGYEPAFATFRSMMTDWRLEERRGVYGPLFGV
jgi:UDP-glucose 4-epimerase